MHEGRKLGFLPNDNGMDGLLCDELVIGARATLCPTLLSSHLHIVNLLLFYGLPCSGFCSNTILFY